MNAAQIEQHLKSPERFEKWKEIRRRMQAFDSRPVVIGPMKSMHRAVLSTRPQYANASR